ncbi:MAG: Gmad2 immunoglobulin-like domain-containing protein [Patescibacteria group bacterium]|nr:Gmad2 immunoglobulin-like domain-containing protein [Patescibacteria group bacterium]
MKRGWIIGGVVLLLAIAGIYAVSFRGGSTSAIQLVTEKGNADMIRMAEPVADAVVRSPLTVSGEARGNWFFEASFPVLLLDEQGNALAQLPAQAGVNPADGGAGWMTTDYVPFAATVSFDAGTSTQGTLVLKKDNPSGLPQYDDQVRISVRFK